MRGVHTLTLLVVRPVSFAKKLTGAVTGCDKKWPPPKRGSTLPSAEDDVAGRAGQPPAAAQAGARKQMWQWEMQGRAALAGVPPPAAQHAQQAQQGELQPLPKGVKVLPTGSEEELEIRAASIVAVERLKDAANALLQAAHAGVARPKP